MILRRASPSLTLKRALVFIAIAALWFIAIINVAFCFDRTLMPLSSYHSKGQGPSRIQQLPVLAQLPVPVPYPFLLGLYLMRLEEQTGGTVGNIYLLGKIGEVTNPAFRGFKSYYAVVYFYKEPIALQILFLIGIVWICRRRKFNDFIVREGPLVIAAVNPGSLVVFLQPGTDRHQAHPTRPGY